MSRDTASLPFRFAVVADAHFHDPRADFGHPFGATSGLALRPLAEVSRLPRLFSETGAALERVLDDIAARGIRDVVLLGDVTDDGQAIAFAGLRRLLDRYRRSHGLRFRGLPGNHDLYGETGRHRTRRFLGASGHIAVTSDTAMTDPSAETLVVNLGMFCGGTASALAALPEAGLAPAGGDIFWETPFGPAPALAERRYPVRSVDGLSTLHATDCSYLCEPAPGVWFLMLDANVFVPHDRSRRHLHREDVADAADAGWNVALAQKPFLIDWIASVARRAKAEGNRLIAFSHYPALDPRGGPWEEAALGPTALSRRIPGPEVGQTLASAGLSLLFTGHLHMDAVTRSGAQGGLTDIAVPSLAAWPAGWKQVTLSADGCEIETVALDDLALPPPASAAYKAELDRTRDGRIAPLVAAGTYGALQRAHARLVVTRRHLRRDWPADLAEIARHADLADVFPPDGPAGPDRGPRVSAATFAEDWYLARMAGALALPEIPPERVALYLALAARAGALLRDGSPRSRFASLLRAFAARVSGPAGPVRLDLAGAPLAPAAVSAGAGEAGSAPRPVPSSSG
ncbi:MAG: metallophosphoesterase family protein [Paracoccaceae bacterium]